MASVAAAAKDVELLVLFSFIEPISEKRISFVEMAAGQECWLVGRDGL